MKSSKLITLNVLDILLDSKNPRFEPIDEQSKIIEELVKSEEIIPLAKDIAINGLSPIESLAVTKDKKNNYIVLEGNRRVCALKLLNDPDKAPSGKVPLFKKISESVKDIDIEIECILFESRTKAQIWLERRHSGYQEGIGTRYWKSNQKTRFNLSNSKPDPNALASSLLDYAVKKGFIEENEILKNLTTATRYLSSPMLRNTIGLHTDTKTRFPDVFIRVDENEFNTVLMKFTQDIISGGNGISSRSNSEDRENYAKSLITDGLAPNTKAKKRNIKDVVIGKTKKESKKKDKKKRDNNHPDIRLYITSSNFSLQIENEVFNRIYRAMKELKVDDHPIAVAALLRYFLEILFRLYHEKSYGNNNLKVKIGTVIDKVLSHIENDLSNFSIVKKSAFKGLKRVCKNENNALNYNNLSVNLHGMVLPDGKSLKKEWDNISSIIPHMVDYIFK